MAREKKYEVKEEFKGTVLTLVPGTPHRMPKIQLQNDDGKVMINVERNLPSLIDTGMVMEGTLVTDEAGLKTMPDYRAYWPEPEWR